MKKRYFKCWARAIYEVFYLKKVNVLSNLMAGSIADPKNVILFFTIWGA